MPVLSKCFFSSWVKSYRKNLRAFRSKIVPSYCTLMEIKYVLAVLPGATEDSELVVLLGLSFTVASNMSRFDSEYIKRVLVLITLLGRNFRYKIASNAARPKGTSLKELT